MTERLISNEATKHDGVRLSDEIKVCPECGSTELKTDFDSQEVVCGKCGLVVDILPPVRSPEWSSFEDDGEDTARGDPISGIKISETLAGTEISIDKTLPMKTQNRFRRLGVLQKRIGLDANKRNLIQAREVLKDLKNTLSLPFGVCETTMSTFKKADEGFLIRGRGISDVVAACVYYSCRVHGIDHNLKDISLASGVSLKVLSKCYRYIITGLKYNVNHRVRESTIASLVSKLGSSQDLELLALRISRRCDEKRLLAGVSPRSASVALLYISSIMLDLGLTQTQICEVADVSEVSLRNNTRRIMRRINFTIEV